MRTKSWAFLCYLLFIPFILQGQFLVADINKSAVGSDPSFVRAGLDHFVFTALSEQYGRELFISDGTEAGTKLVKDFNPGNASSQFWEVHIIDSLCYFIRSFDTDHLQYGVFNLYNPRPVLLKTLPASIGSEYNGKFTKLGNSVYFIHRSDNYRVQLWKTDGTPENTTQFYEFGQNVFPDHFDVLNHQLIFLAQDPAGLKQLWKSDGTAQGTSLIKSVDTQKGVLDYEVFNNKIFFVANDGTSGWDIWESDATVDGTQLFVDLEPNTLARTPGQLTVASNKLFFTAYDAKNGRELWMSDGTPQNTRIVKDIYPGQTGSSPYSLAAFKQQLLFVADEGQFGAEPWISDGTAEGTHLLKDIFKGVTGSFPDIALNGTANAEQFFFVAKDSVLGKTLWRTDGTAEGTILLNQITTGSNLIEEAELIAFQQNIYFKTQDGVHGLELWKSKGTAEGARIFTKLNATGAGSAPNQIRVFKDKLFFSARTEQLGFELWKSDGTTVGTQMVKDLYPGSESGDILLPTLFKDLYVFGANSATPYGRYLWKSDGTPEGTVILKDNQGRGIISTEYIAVLKDKLIFNAYSPEFGEELWVSDGTETGTYMLKDIDTKGQSFPYLPPFSSVLQDSLLFFTANDGIHGDQLWKTDGSEEGTTLVTDLALIRGQVGDILGKFGDSLLLSVSDFFGVELWISGGRNEGARRLKDIAPGGEGSYPGNLVAIGKQFYFTANDLSHGTEVWKSDGSFNGTVLLKDILPGEKSSIPYQLTQHQNELFFVVGENSNGKDALWKTNGTPEGTVQVKQIPSANNFSYIRNLFSWGPFIYFSADDGIHGHELWRSDGTEEGTTMLADLNVGSASSDPGNFTSFKNDLYFSADDGIHGVELWRLLSDNVVSTTETDIAEILIFPNPATDKLTIRKTEENKNLQIRLYDSQGRTVIKSTLLRNTSTDFNVSNLSTGFYVLEILETGSTKKFSKKIVIVR